jgi:hypothetical protein
MSKIYRITDHPDLLKDGSCGAILLNDIKKADDYRSRKNMLTKTKSMDEELNTLKSKMAEIDALREDMATIKDLLQRIVNK